MASDVSWGLKLLELTELEELDIVEELEELEELDVIEELEELDVVEELEDLLVTPPEIFFAVFIKFLLAEQPVSAIDSKITENVNKQFFFFIRTPNLNLIFRKYYIYIYIYIYIVNMFLKIKYIFNYS